MSHVGGDMSNVNREKIDLICDEIIQQGSVQRTYDDLVKWIYSNKDYKTNVCPFGMKMIDDECGRYKKCLCHIYWEELINIEYIINNPGHKRVSKFCPCKYVFNLKCNQDKITLITQLDIFNGYSDMIPHAKALLKELRKRYKIRRSDNLKFHIIRILLMEI